jgi:alanyl-tRNA synthetase
VCGVLGANINTVENTAKKLKQEYEGNRGKLRMLSREKLAAIQPESNGRLALFRGVFSSLADDQLQEFAGEKIAGANDVVVLIANVGLENASIVFARSEKLTEIDCNKLFKEAAGADGRGGGKLHFVTGVVKKEAAGRVADIISKKVLS